MFIRSLFLKKTIFLRRLPADTAKKEKPVLFYEPASPDLISLSAPPLSRNKQYTCILSECQAILFFYLRDFRAVFRCLPYAALLIRYLCLSRRICSLALAARILSFCFCKPLISFENRKATYTTQSRIRMIAMRISRFLSSIDSSPFIE